MSGKSLQMVKQRKKDQKEDKKKKESKKVQSEEEEILDMDFQWEADQEFDVQKILEKDVRKGKTYYLIKWKGFDICHSTWEEEGVVKHLKNLIEDFKKSSVKNPSSKRIKEDPQNIMNPYLATAIHGHFLYGDKPKKIVNTYVKFDSNNKKTIFHQIQWELRPTDRGLEKLENSIIDSNMIFDHQPDFLLESYIKSLKITKRK